MHFLRSFSIFLTVTASLIFNVDIIKAKETIFGCTGKLLEKKILRERSRSMEKIYHNLKNIKIPERFDAREKWPSCKTLQDIKTQGVCGGCWAFAAASVMADRLCIATDGKYDKPLSEQDLLECCSPCAAAEIEAEIGGCQGGIAYEAFLYWEKHGLVTGAKGCKPIEPSTLKGNPQKECRSRCTNESYKVEYAKDKTFSVKTIITDKAEKSDIPHLMAEIMLNGPIVGGMTTFLYLNFAPPDAILTYNKSLIKSYEIAAGHSIKIIGWDKINGTPVWIIANSWGTDWCNKGFCYIRRGNNELDIESHIFSAGIPKVKVSKKKQEQTEKTGSSGSNFIKITNPIQTAVILCMLSKFLLFLKMIIVH